ncbi:MAG: hypothetical protein HY720_30050 [Planctomycetes bacterium]|nr:hypothetical protein [Planctomycetota bacterium]
MAEEKPQPATRKAATRRKKPAGKKALTARERSRLLRPATNYEEAAGKAVTEWTARRKIVKVPDLTPKRLQALVNKAKRAQGKERKAAQRLQLAKDARMLADHTAWKALLDLKAFVETASRRAPELLKAFDFLIRLMKRAPAGSGAKTNGEPEEKNP